MEKREMGKAYQPAEIEGRIYAAWEAAGAFRAERIPGKRPFTIMMPPPNITGKLHMGHALDAMPQDVLARYHRMRGEPTLWLPGTDHASIATEVKIVEALRAEGLTKRDIGREEYMRRAWAWRDTYGRQIVSQLRRLGASCDWGRERFTMDEGLNRAVVEVFVRLYERGLIYRGDRIINWCPVCKTALSDAEVEYEEREGALYSIRYEGEGFSVVVATTRPETMLGDTAIAVNPGDERYAKWVGRTVTLPLIGREIPIVADGYADPEYGTGAVKVTPAHDPNDFEIGLRHGLESIRVIGDDGTMGAEAGPYAGLSREACREAVLEALRERGLLVGIEPIRHNVGECYRCRERVEPLVSTQWFVRMEPLARPAIDAVREGSVRFVPERFAKTYYNWMEGIRDWCVSRQLWWGHRIPAYYCEACGATIVAREAPGACGCGGALRQDEDVLDTWFSSALWPFSTLGWPEETEDYEYFYPTSVLSCGYDIIFFWAARMIFSGLSQTGIPPFHTVLMHGLVRDAQGRKMSKSLDNGIDPIEMIDRYGADALRFSLALGVAPGNDLRISEERIEASRNFANKLWNAARFVLMNRGEGSGGGLPEDEELSIADRWILSRYAARVREVTGHLEAYELGMAAQACYDFLWDDYCDWYIELCKDRLSGSDGAARRGAQAVLEYALAGTIRLLHPFMPFVTEEIHAALTGGEAFLMRSDWPDAGGIPDYAEDAAGMEGAMEIIRSIRNLRAEMKVPQGKKTRLAIRPRAGWEATLGATAAHIRRLAFVSEVAFLGSDDPSPEKSVSAACAAGEFYVPMGDLADIGKELARVGQEIEATIREIARTEGKLANPGFLSKAPSELVEREREKLAAQRELLKSHEARRAELEAY